MKRYSVSKCENVFVIENGLALTPQRFNFLTRP